MKRAVVVCRKCRWCRAEVEATERGAESQPIVYASLHRAEALHTAAAAAAAG